MVERLQKVLSEYGIMSRRNAERLISEGKIKVDGQTAFLGQKIDPDTAKVTVSGKPVSFKKNKLIYIMLNKPRGYITSLSDEKGRPVVTELLEDIEERVYPVGRLDYDSEGLLILTNDGDLANHLMHPSMNKEKTYRVTVRGLTEASLKALGEPMVIDGYRIRPADVRLIGEMAEYSTVDIKIHEGRNRQIRKMCEKCKIYVYRLRRIDYAGIALSDLKTGAWRYLTQAEISKLKQ